MSSPHTSSPQHAHTVYYPWTHIFAFFTIPLFPLLKSAKHSQACDWMVAGAIPRLTGHTARVSVSVPLSKALILPIQQISHQIRLGLHWAVKLPDVKACECDQGPAKRKLTYSIRKAANYVKKNKHKMNKTPKRYSLMVHILLYSVTVLCIFMLFKS